MDICLMSIIILLSRLMVVSHGALRDEPVSYLQVAHAVKLVNALNKPP